MIDEGFIEKLSDEGAKKPISNPHFVVLKWFCFMVLYFIAILSFEGVRDDLGQKFTENFFQLEIFVMLIVVVTSSYAASFLALPDDNQNSWIRFLPFVPLLAVFGMIIYGIVFNSESLSLLECMRLKRFDCIIHVMFYSIFPAFLMFYMIQKSAPIRCNFVGALAGLSSSSLGYVMLRFTTQRSEDPTSLLIWHFVPVLLIVGICVMVGKIFLKNIWKKM